MSEDENEINLRFRNPFIEDKSFAVIDDDAYKNINKFDSNDEVYGNMNKFDSNFFNGPIIEGDIIELPDEIEFEVNDENTVLDIFDMKPGESCEISLEDFIRIISQNQEELSFTLNPETFPDEADIISEDDEVSLEEFIAHIIAHSSKGMGFGIIEDNDDFI